MGEEISKCNCAQPIPEIQHQSQPIQNNNYSHFDILNDPSYQQSTMHKQQQYSDRTDLEQTKKVSQFQYSEQHNKITQKLCLTVIASATLPDNTSLELSFENMEMKTMYFGCKYKNKKNGYRVNNVKIPCIDKKISEKNRGQHFYIKYDYQRESFRIKDLGIGFGVFTKQQEIDLQNNTLINIGSMYFTSQICNGQELLKLPQFNNLYDVKEFIVCGYPCERQQFLQTDRNQSYLRLNFYGGQAKDDVYILSSKNFLPIQIGRNIDCLIRYYDDNMLSKYQCTIVFDGKWRLIDGAQGKISTNGTWVYIKDEVDLLNNMMIKTNNTIFLITLQ